MFLAHAAPGLAQAPEASQAIDYSELIDELERDVRRTMRGEDIAGAALVLLDGQRVVYRNAWGMASTEDDRPLTETTPMLVGDLAKVPTAIAVLQLAAAGRLALDAPLSDYLELAYVGRDPDWRPPRIHELLTHHAGLAPNRFADAFRAEPANGIELIAPLPRTQPPGLIYSYSQLGCWGG